MTKVIYLSCIFMFFFFIFSNVVHAIENPLAVPNNKFGIHVIDENDLENAASLVNSSGGDWGYVTIVITESDRNTGKWQKIFDKMRQLHLIPIIRLATNLEGNNWKKPEVSEVNSWTDFLSRLKWVVKNRYVIIFNEPNHAKEYGGLLDPAHYAEILSTYSASLKKRSADFFILPAALDASAPNSLITMDELAFLKSMITARPEIFTVIDGWNSHSYPNPGFTNNIDKTGKGTLYTYKWERDILSSWGFNKDLPIFITETGWPHQEGKTFNRNYLPAEKVADYINAASAHVWQDENIVAITPFVLNYQSPPFSNFSWQMPDTDEFYPQFDTYRSIPKTAGQPILPVLEEITPTGITTPSAVLGQQNKKGSIEKLKLFIYTMLYIIKQ